MLHRLKTFLPLLLLLAPAWRQACFAMPSPAEGPGRPAQLDQAGTKAKPATRTKVRERLSELTVDARITITLSDGTRITGRFVDLREDTLDLNHRHRAESYSLDEIVKVEKRWPTRAKVVLWGGIVGCMTYLVIGLSQGTQ